MIEIKTLEIAGFAGALQALRLPFSKECRSLTTSHYSAKPFAMPIDSETDGLMFNTSSEVVAHEKDLQLIQTLIKRGDEHSKILRGIMVWAEICAPRYWWQEMDKYSIGADCLSSESTMHTLKNGAKIEDFDAPAEAASEMALKVNHKAEIYRNAISSENADEMDKEHAFLSLKRALPECFIQKRIWCFNYQTLRRIYKQRRNHRLPHWRFFCKWIETLPFAKELITIGIED